jgi:hypothetical protein
VLDVKEKRGVCQEVSIIEQDRGGMLHMHPVGLGWFLVSIDFPKGLVSLWF